MFSGLSLRERLKREFEEGKKVVDEESVPGAQSFVAGKGRGGRFSFD